MEKMDHLSVGGSIGASSNGSVETITVISADFRNKITVKKTKLLVTGEFLLRNTGICLSGIGHNRVITLCARGLLNVW